MNSEHLTVNIESNNTDTLIGIFTICVFSYLIPKVFFLLEDKLSNLQNKVDSLTSKIYEMESTLTLLNYKFDQINTEVESEYEVDDEESEYEDDEVEEEDEIEEREKIEIDDFSETELEVLKTPKNNMLSLASENTLNLLDMFGINMEPSEKQNIKELISSVSDLDADSAKELFSKYGDYLKQENISSISELIQKSYENIRSSSTD